MSKGEIPEGYVVRHMCHNTKCCNPDHLQVGTNADNMRDMVEARRSLAGEKNPAAKLTYDEVKLIREMRSKGFTLKKIAKLFDVHFSTVDLIARGKIWQSSP